MPFFLGSILAYILLPVVDFPRSPRAQVSQAGEVVASVVDSHRLCRRASALIAGTLAYFVPAVRSQGQVFVEEVLPNYFERVQAILTYDFPLSSWSRSPRRSRRTVNASLEKAVATLLTGVQKGIEVTLQHRLADDQLHSSAWSSSLSGCSMC